MAGRRRSASEWANLIRELERSGKPLREFARGRGIRPDTLKWWCWRLGAGKARKAKAHRVKPKRDTRVRLLEVEPVSERKSQEAQPVVPVWELVAPSGHALRVYDRAGLRVLKAALSAVSGTRRR